MKRILSLIITLSMLLSMTVYAETTNSGTHELDLWGYDRYLEILSDIGVEIPKLELSGSLTRGDFIKSLNAFFGHSHLNTSSTSYDEYINTAYDSGWITEAEKNNFNPTEPILLGDAAKYIVNALGYKTEVEYMGNTDQDYFAEAAKLGLCDDITTKVDAPISYAQMLKMFYNTMEVNIFKYKAGDRYEEGKSMLYEIHKVSVLKGIVTANYQSGLAGKACGENIVEIEGTQYECHANTDGLVGKYTISFVRDNLVLHILESAKKNKIVKIANEDIEDFSNLKTLTYLDEDNDEEKIDFDYPPSIFVNGTYKAISSLSELETIVGENGEFEAIDNDSDGKYEVVRITNYITYVVDKINYNKGIITDTHINKVIEIGTDKYKVTIIKDGETATFEDIKAKDVVEISADSEYVTDEGVRTIDFETCKYITILATSASVGGIVNEIKANSKLEIDESEYELSDYFKDGVEAGHFDPMRINVSGAFYVNHIGKIVYVNTAANALDKYGFLIWGNYEMEYDGVVLKVYTTNQKVETFELASKVTIDGESKENTQDLMNLRQLFADVDGNKKIKNQLIIYRLNSENKIRYIDTALVTNSSEDSETSLRMDVEFYGNSMATASQKLYNSGTLRYNGPGDVYAAYSSGNRYVSVNLKPSSENIFVVSGFLGDTTKADYDTNKNKYMLEAHDNMQIAEPTASASNFQITTSSYFGNGDYNFSSGRCIQFYNVGDDNSVSYMVYYNPALSPGSVQEVTASSGSAFYSDRGKTMNMDGEVTDYIEIYVPGETEPKILVCKDEDVIKNMTFSNMDNKGELKTGDVIRYNLTVNGEVGAIKRDLDFAKMMSELEADQEPACFASYTYTGIESKTNYDVVIRWLGTSSSSFMTLMTYNDWFTKDLSIEEAAKIPGYRVGMARTSNVMIYDVNADCFEAGTIDDLYTAKECGNDASVLYVRHTVSKPDLILAYNFLPQK